MSARDPRQAPKDYPDPLDDPDPFDPTGYYARKARKNAEMLPFLVALYLLALAMVAGAVIYSQRENIMTGYIIVGVACLFIGWNVPQPAYAKRAQDWVMSKVRRS